ncbi:MAG: hypothetical protein ACHQM4_12300, partial [Thermoanaerobaculia bacterium]
HTADGRSVLEVAKGAGLGVLVNRPLNAFSGRSLVRFAALAPDILRELGRDAVWDEERARPLASYLDTAFAPAGAVGSSLAQRTLHALLGTPGVDVVLVGMRRPAYVRDAVGAFA